MPEEIKDQLKAICKEYSYRSVLEAIADEYYQPVGNDKGATPRRLKFEFQQSVGGCWIDEDLDPMSLYQSQVRDEDSF